MKGMNDKKNMSRDERVLKTARAIEAFLPCEKNPGWWDILDAVSNMTAREQLEALIVALDMGSGRWSASCLDTSSSACTLSRRVLSKGLSAQYT